MKHRSILALCAIYNRASNPAKFRSDNEHKRARLLTRLARAHIERQYRYGVDYIESDTSGRYWPTRYANPFTGELVQS